ncbi:MAG TPA: 1-(5-phosphoribosyl)-5-[(5-phosphoribosylamino)methylideneamino] imidazole-4-carboxamide isomerase [Steroidobacteraceae bacterium]|nr:1-(5-phosphoribosyl)-5-[(5-phosphoribosylamino)methylideneamino] imidazole-4-carboxamide isomerase [Steroidobacteraceae bacterium]
MLLIPAIDLRGGGVVRLMHGDFNAETRYSADPRAILTRYRQAGAAWLHVVDLDGARDGVLANRALIVELAAQTGIHLQVGGGVRSADVIEDLFASGIARVVVGSAAIEKPDLVRGWLVRYGPERVCLAFDVKADNGGVPRVRTRGWTAGGSLSLWDAIDLYPARSVRHVLCTDIDRDGSLSGPNLELYAQGTARYPHLQWQASGGVRSAADLTELARLQVAATVSGKALLENRIHTEELRPFLPGASFPASTSATARS